MKPPGDHQAPGAGGAAHPPGSGARPALGALFASSLRLGLTSFGGPVAHIGYFHAEWVARRRWMGEREFADLLALCQFLPGPASSQMIFATGLRLRGIAGGLIASLCFTMPSALLMIGAAFGFSALAGGDPGWLHGLKVAAVAVVARAVHQMAGRMCPDRARASLAAAAAVLVLVWPTAGGQVVAILAGGLLGAWWWRDSADDAAAGRRQRPPGLPGRRAGAAALLTFAALLFGLPVAVQLTGEPGLDAVHTFYRAGSLVFGGGHVILPLLRTGVVAPGWIGDESFLAGYGAAQALPGPLFSFAAYLGALLSAGPGGIPGALLCLGSIFLPSLLLVGGVLPFWERLRQVSWTQAALRGTNAAVVGVLLAAFYDPVWREGVRGPAHFSVALAGFAALAWWKAPPWLVVALSAAAGAVWL